MRYLGDSRSTVAADKELPEWGYNVGVLGGLRLSLAEEPKPALGRGLGLSKVFGWQDAGRRYDIVVLGATGFTGRLMVEHLDGLLCGQAQSPKKWAIAGRNMQRLRTLCSSCRSSPDVLLADSQASLDEVARQCVVLIAAAGPYSQCGEMAVRACVASRTHYVDVSGETVWMHEMLQRYHAEAKQQGILLVQAAAQVCAVDDINCYLLAQKLGPLKQFREYFFQFGGTTGGTFASSASGMEDMTEEKLKVTSSATLALHPYSCGSPCRRMLKGCVVQSSSMHEQATSPEVLTLLSHLENGPLSDPVLTWALLAPPLPEKDLTPPPGLGEPGFAGNLLDEKMQLHLTKQCHPCVAFAFKKDRCWKGDACSHCHICSPDEAKARRRELQERARKLKRVQKAVEKAERGEGASLWL
ncbi:ldp-1 [Symbiodinium natans]|uniref:Ldp-1 protein n=1 Tax=Symbiodinium natans TaxID=878477 RepID=A0A812QUL1_9DINO|nr:ldp-1 [Symbiodinium natans]